MGISGGEEGARVGPSLMPGGSKFAYDQVVPILLKCAAQVESSGPCVGYLGPTGAVRRVFVFFLIIQKIVLFVLMTAKLYQQCHM